MRLVCCIALCVLTRTCAQLDSSDGESSQLPSIVFLVADDLGSYDLSLTNPERHTPTIDRLAREGVQFSRYYSYKYCSPARASLLTGRYPGHGIWEYNPDVDTPVGLNESMVMLPAALKRVGYKTHLVGKWHLGFYQSKFLPYHRGFDSSFGFVANGNQRAYDQVDPAIPGPNQFGPCAGTDLWNTSHEAWGMNGTYDAWMYTGVGQNIIRQHNFSSAPLFLMMMFHNVHLPMEAPEIYYNQSYFDQNMLETRLIYNGMCAALDESVANITATLEEVGAMNNTIVIFISDNGGNVGTGESAYRHTAGNNYPLRGGKYSFFEGGVRCPAFVYAPGILSNSSAGQIIDSYAHVSDWYTTLTDLVNAPLSTGERKGLDGHNIWPAIMSPATVETNRSEIVLGLDGATYPPSGAYIHGHLKLIVGAPGGEYPNCWYGTKSPNGTLYCDVGANLSCSPRPCLFNITADPTEHHDIGPEKPGLLNDMRRRYELIRERMGSAKNPGSARECMHSTCAIQRGYFEWNGAYHSISTELAGATASLMVGVNPNSTPCQVMLNNSRWWRPWGD